MILRERERESTWLLNKRINNTTIIGGASGAGATIVTAAANQNNMNFK